MQVLDRDAHSTTGSFNTTTQQCFAAKQGLLPQLDLARITFTQLTEQIHDLVAKYRTSHHMPDLKARHTCVSRACCILATHALGTSSSQLWC